MSSFFAPKQDVNPCGNGSEDLIKRINRENNTKKNKYSGTNFDDFLKEEAIYNEVKALAQKELEALCSEDPLELNDTYNLPEDPPGASSDFSNGSDRPATSKKQAV